MNKVKKIVFSFSNYHHFNKNNEARCCELKVKSQEITQKEKIYYKLLPLTSLPFFCTIFQHPNPETQEYIYQHLHRFSF